MKKSKKLFVLFLLTLPILIYLAVVINNRRSETDVFNGDKIVNTNNLNSPNNLLVQGRNIYDKYCVACHGVDGKGDGPEAYRLNTKPTDFASGKIKFKSTPYGAMPEKSDIIATLKLGVRTTAMLPQWQLTGRQMNAVASYVISLMPKNQKKEKAIEISDAPAMSDTLLSTGKSLFEINCASCHGKDAEGNGPLSKKLTDYRQNPIVPPNLTLRPLKRANTQKRMFVIISTGVEGTPMPPFQYSLKPEQRWAIVGYVESLKSHYRSSNNHGMMGRMMKHRFVGEESKGMKIDMAAARAWMMKR
ncbi:MAG: c-type cytochrome [Chlorobi bacterium]|nr:c-type cytochrome [Chlorobiota bacterium]